MIYYIKKLFSHPKIQALVFMLLSIASAASLLTYNPSDPSFNLATNKHSTNLLGYFGSYLADFLYQLFGLSSFIFPICYFVLGVILYRKGEISWLFLRILVVVAIAIVLTPYFHNIEVVGMPAGAGGALGIIIAPWINDLGVVINLSPFLLACIALLLCLGISFKGFLNILVICRQKLANKIIQPQSLVKEVKTPITFKEKEQKVKIFSNSTNNGTAVSEYGAPVNPTLPPIELLKNLENQNIKLENSAQLKENSEKLLTVLGDFGVKGQIIDISQGPVVTLYEFEPAAGTKSSRVIGLSDDIARSLSAISTRIGTIPGRNVLGVELPNKQRAFFCLRELIETPQYRDSNGSLPLILGKDLAGKPFIVDLAKMPHLLVAGTTGSGKSVAINTMIMSLLYRYTPQECRLIMIDPKMLELSIYDNIPHLLTPVVTESPKAVIALKWAVKEMENRYRLMSNLGVRNIAGYNAKIIDALNSGKVLERTVQTGFDPETGKPIYQSVPINMEKLPFIVLIVDEMADLMLVAGKDIEASIQRLAQMARAAGIHIIMATQRPSVDVITGVIKANFPSRISFKVISKIDSRTILGEQGAEQLLGMGDMLYMGSASSITRIHGPFVDDKEVERVTEYLRSLGSPQYVSAVVEQPEDEISGIEDLGGEGDDEGIYRKALQIVRLERKVSISYIQRSLRIGYNRAANIVERMEKEGVVSSPGYTGKREILLPEE